MTDEALDALHAKVHPFEAAEVALVRAIVSSAAWLSEADEAAFAPRVFISGEWKVYAPVEDDLAFLRGRLAP